MAAGRETTFRGHAVGYVKRLPCNFDRTSEKYNVPFSVSAATDVSEHRGVMLFCENLTHYLEGLPLENVIDWERGY